MAFKNEERKSNIISGSDIFRKVVDERFENLINEIKTAGIEGRTNAGRNSFAQLIQQFQYIWDDNESAFIQPLVAFVNIATQIGCYGCDNVTPARKEEVANYSGVNSFINQSAISIIIFSFLFSHISRCFFSSFFPLHSAFRYSNTGNLF